MTNFTFNIHISKNRRTIVAIDRFEIAGQKITFLFGESGIGKTIISKAIYGLLDSDSLDIHINGMTYEQYLGSHFTRKLRQHGFFVFQEPSTHLNPLITLSGQLKEGSLHRAPGEKEILRYLWDTTHDAIFRRILSVYPKPYRPSGGEKQRILLAMAFKKINLLRKSNTVPPEAIFIFDEPSGSLDNHFRNRFLQLLLSDFQQIPFTALVITHDYSMIGEVHEKYPELRSSIVYRELALETDQLLLRDFAPRLYLNWLKSAKHTGVQTGGTSEPLLSLQSGYRVFGKTMVISRQENGGAPCPLQLHRGEMVYLKAASGIGKTTLAKIMMGLIPCQGLSLRIMEHQINELTSPGYWKRHIWGKKAGLVFQHADEALNLNATVREVFGGLPFRHKLNNGSIRTYLEELFDPPVSEGFLKKKVAYLSGGQKQRLNLLRTLMLDTDILILDEPLNGLDFESIQKVLGMLQQKQQEGKAILLISHNEDIFDAIIPPSRVYYLKES